MMSQISLIITLGMLTICAITDATDRKVKNIVVFPCIVTGVILSFMQSAWTGLTAIAWLVFFFFFGMLKIMGMGDLKLIMAVVCLRGSIETALMMLGGTILLFEYCLMTERRDTIYVLRDTFLFLTFKRPIRKYSDTLYPFAVFLAFGYPLAWFLCNGWW